MPILAQARIAYNGQAARRGNAARWYGCGTIRWRKPRRFFSPSNRFARHSAAGSRRRSDGCRTAWTRGRDFLPPPRGGRSGFLSWSFPHLPQIIEAYSALKCRGAGNVLHLLRSRNAQTRRKSTVKRLFYYICLSEFSQSQPCILSPTLARIAAEHKNKGGIFG